MSLGIRPLPFFFVINLHHQKKPMGESSIAERRIFMYGAMLGDIIGRRFEFDRVGKCKAGGC